MQLSLMTLLVLLWFIGGCVRIYRQARFYQIEEYMSRRYGRWLMADYQRYLPSRAIGVTFIGMALAFINDSIPDQVTIVPYIIGSIASLIAIYPTAQGEIKKAFVRTQRVTRILITAFVLLALYLVVVWWIIHARAIISDRVIVIALMSGGLLGLLLAPLWLMLGNLLMSPVEAFKRQTYIRQAQTSLATIQPKIIGITGSYGKTTTKNFLHHLLNARYKTYATPKSYNTLMGVTLAINTDLADDYSVEYFISEMGAYVEGEIERICQLTPPDISIVTAVGPQHLERFGTIEHIVNAKYEIISNLPPDGLAVFNWDNDDVRTMYERGYPQQRIAISKHLNLAEAQAEGVRFIATDITETLSGLSFTVHDTQTGEQQMITTSIVGEHNVTNLLLAIAVAQHEGMRLSDIAFRARSLQPAESRLVREATASGITIINDAYSANPVGVLSSLKVLGMYQDGKRLLITPGMVELGHLQDQENYKLGQAATKYATDIILVGEKQTQAIAEGISSTTFPPDRLHIFETLSEATAWYPQHLSAGDTVLFLNDLPDTY